MGSKFVSFPKPRSCETLKIPLDALANEKEMMGDNDWLVIDGGNTHFWSEISQVFPN